MLDGTMLALRESAYGYPARPGAGIPLQPATILDLLERYAADTLLRLELASECGISKTESGEFFVGSRNGFKVLDTARLGLRVVVGEM